MKNNKDQKNKLDLLNAQIDKMAMDCAFDYWEEAYIKNIDRAMEFALGNSGLHKSVSNRDIKSMYTDAQILKKLVRLLSKRCQLLVKINGK
ncbi:hypothetical protein QQ020_19455 [Fulvivirgaceae bacterium BMA12]|uniref:Uncharacterized protein n=1 Tax=Agaribacillus aureus TaxID=3051825 RepID=A0ABT8L928_9BACT|nr:hypothetical protein [Fulvivirgaceae bacterium BMA12]